MSQEFIITYPLTTTFGKTKEQQGITHTTLINYGVERLKVANKCDGNYRYIYIFITDIYILSFMSS